MDGSVTEQPEIFRRPPGPARQARADPGRGDRAVPARVLRPRGDRRGAGRARGAGAGRRNRLAPPGGGADHGAARPRQERLHRHPRRQRPDPAARPRGRARAGGLRAPGRPRHRRHRRRRGHRDGDPARGRAVAGDRPLAPAGEEPAAAARQGPRPAGHRDPLPPARARPDRQRGEPADLPDPRPDDHRDPPLARRARLRRGRDAGPAAALRRRPGAALHHPPQRARPRPLPADRDRALPQAADRRRHRPGLRARQGLPQRGRLAQAQPRVHDARVVRGLRRLREDRARPRAVGRRGRRADAGDDQGPAR